MGDLCMVAPHQALCAQAEETSGSHDSLTIQLTFARWQPAGWGVTMQT